MTTVALAVTWDVPPESFMLGYKMGSVTVQLPSASNGWTVAGIVIDLSTHFNKEVKAAWPADVDAYADNQYKWGVRITNAGATPATDVILTGHYCETSGGVMNPIPTDTDLSAVGKLRLIVIGR